MSENNIDKENKGYVSNSISDDNGLFEENPKITIDLEAPFVAYGMLINFVNTYPSKFTIATYYYGEEVQRKEIKNND